MQSFVVERGNFISVSFLTRWHKNENWRLSICSLYTLYTTLYLHNVRATALAQCTQDCIYVTYRILYSLEVDNILWRTTKTKGCTDRWHHVQLDLPGVYRDAILQVLPPFSSLTRPFPNPTMPARDQHVTLSAFSCGERMVRHSGLRLSRLAGNEEAEMALTARPATQPGATRVSNEKWDVDRN